MFFVYLGLNFAVLLMLVLTSRGSGIRLWLSVAFFGWSVSQLNTLIEAVAFLVMPLSDALLQLAISAVAFTILTGIALLPSGKVRDRSEPAEVAFSARNLALVIVAYEFFYWTAGTLVWPFVAEFYTAKGLPPAPFVAALQIPRALIFAVAVWPWLRTNPRLAPLTMGIAFAVLGGIAPAFPDNPYMPAAVRWAHAIEAGSSNFLFGILVGWLLRARPETSSAAASR